MAGKFCRPARRHGQHKTFFRASFAGIVFLVLWFALPFQTGADGNKNDSTAPLAKEIAKTVNVYSARKRHLIRPLLDQFEKKTSITVNLTTAKSDALITRLHLEKNHPNADIFITTDVGRLHRLKNLQLLQPLKSAWLEKNVPPQYRDSDGQWYGLSVRFRVIVAARRLPNSVRPERYEDLASPKWHKKICVRSSDNVYNQSLIASLIVANGRTATQDWAESLVDNFARPPAGGDRDQILAVAHGGCDLALANTYYLAMMRESKDKEQSEAVKRVDIIWPNQEDRGVHVNVSGAGIIKGAKHPEAAQKLLEYLLSDSAQAWYARVNHEYPVISPSASANDTLPVQETFKRDDTALHRLGALNSEAVKLADRAGWR